MPNGYAFIASGDITMEATLTGFEPTFEISQRYTISAQSYARLRGKHCLIYEKDLERIWPINEKDRKERIAQFAMKYGFHLRFYGKGMGAIFEKWPQQQAGIQGGESGRQQ
jgi:hypothetical protein